MRDCREGILGDATRENKVVRFAYREAVLHIADLWQERVTANRDRAGFSISVSAPTNAEAHDISLAIRDRRRTLGEVGQDQIKLQATDGEGVRLYDLALAPGDRVRLFSRVNAKFLDSGTVGNIGRNGTVLEIAEIRDDERKTAGHMVADI